MSHLQQWTIRLLPLAMLLAGCHDLAPHRYVGGHPSPWPTAPITPAAMTTSTSVPSSEAADATSDQSQGSQASSRPAEVTKAGYAPEPIVRGQNGGAYNGYQGSQPNGTGFGPPPAPGGGATYQNNVIPAPNGGTAPPPGGSYQNNGRPTPTQTYQGPPGYVGGSIGVQPQGQPAPVISQPYGAAGPNMMNQLPPGGVIYEPAPDPFRTAPVDVILQETETGRFMFGVGINSDAGVTGNIVIDERNFDIRRVPRSFAEIADGTAFRGAGQGFRIEAVPGTEVQRYVVNFTEPYLFNTNVSFNTSGFLFTRRYLDWDEERVGGRLGLGYRLTPDLSVNSSLRAERVNVNDISVNAGPQLLAAAGKHDIYSGKVALTYDTRDVPFAPTEGHMFELSFEQVFGSFVYPRIEADYRRYFLVAERPDGSGRHVLSYQFRGGYTGDETPVFENFYAGGYSSLRGFDFRGANPKENGISIGGEFLFLGSVQYQFPLTQDDMISGVVFVDYGTVEEKVEIDSGNYRVAPGFGLRIAVPAIGPAPIALDFAFPVAHAQADDREVFSFFIGVGR